MDLSAPEEHVFDDRLHAEQDEQTNCKNGELIDCRLVRDWKPQLSHTVDGTNNHPRQKEKPCNGREETLDHNRSFAIGKRVENPWRTYHG